jgi:hypothetical protein
MQEFCIAAKFTSRLVEEALLSQSLAAGFVALSSRVIPVYQE